MSTTPDSTLDDPQQTIADLKRQLTERTAERDEALEQQTATAEVLQVINSSPGDLASVFDAMLEKAIRLCEAACGHLYTYDGDRFHPIAVRGEPRFVERWRQSGPIRPLPDGPAPLARVARGERIVGVDDFREDPAYRTVPAFRATVDASNTRSGVTVALRNDVALLGAITIYRQEVRPFTKQQIALLQNFAAQAVIAIANAQLITETQEALDQQTATAEVLGVINSSPGDLAPVFDTILEKAIRLCEAMFGTLWTYDGDRYLAVAQRNVPPEYAEFLREPLRVPPGTVVGQLAAGKQVAQIADIAAAEYYERGGIAHPALALGGFRTVLGVALRKDDALLGAITIYRQEVRPFSEKQIALLQNFAAQAVIAMENARLITETREALEQQTATAEVLQVINSSPGDLAPVFDAILEKAHSLCGATLGSLRLYDGKYVRAVAVRGHEGDYADELRRGVALSDRVVTSLLQGAPFLQFPDMAESDDPGPRASFERSGGRTALIVPLRKDSALLGMIFAARQEVQPFTDKQIALLQNFAAQAVIAMENARLITETREALEQQTATAEVLGVINSSPGDLAPVFDAMLEKTLRLCEAAHGNFLTYDGEVFHQAAFRGEPQFAEYRRLPQQPAEVGQLARMVQGGGTLHRIDAREGEAYRDDPAFRRMVDGLGIRTSLTVPLRKGDALLGAVRAYRLEVRPFTDKQIALVENFAAQAVIAMENARLITETQEALERQTATAEVLQVINASPGNLTPVFETVLEKAMDLCGIAFGNLQLYEGKFRAVALRGEHAPALAQLLREPIEPVPGAPSARLLSGERFVHIVDIAEAAKQRPNDLRAQANATAGSRTVLFVPLRRDGDLLGFIVGYRKEVRPFTDNQIALLQNFAAQAVIAMENARLLGELRQRTEEVGELNRGLEARVAEQVDELSRVGRLKRFLAPQLAELIVSQGDEKILESHRREIVVVFCDLRGYTAFTETAEPEEVLDFLRQYHGALGPLVSQYEGTLDQFSGDGIMVFFNDPVPVPDPAERAVKMAMAMREAAGDLIAAWRRRGRELGFGAGIAQGYATLGQIGFAERSGYTAIGTVCNVAARLCAEAKDGQILLGQRVAVAVEGTTALEEIGALTLKGLTQPVVAYNVPLAATHPALRVIEGGPESI